MKTVAIAVVCKTPAAGLSKTRLSPPLHPEECAAISSCFIRDLSATIQTLANEGGVTGYALFTPRGSEPALRRLLPQSFRLMPQCEGDLGARLLGGTIDLLAAGHAGAIMVNSDSPTLPAEILHAAVAAVRRGDNVTLSPALDGGYTLIGLSRAHAPLFENMPWSTDVVYRLTVERAKMMGVPVVAVPGWYDVDDGASYRMLEEELAGRHPPCGTGLSGAAAPATRQFVRQRQLQDLPLAATM